MTRLGGRSSGVERTRRGPHPGGGLEGISPSRHDQGWVLSEVGRERYSRPPDRGPTTLDSQ